MLMFTVANCCAEKTVMVRTIHVSCCLIEQELLCTHE